MKGWNWSLNIIWILFILSYTEATVNLEAFSECLLYEMGAIVSFILCKLHYLISRSRLCVCVCVRVCVCFLDTSKFSILVVLVEKYCFVIFPKFNGILTLSLISLNLLIFYLSHNDDSNDLNGVWQLLLWTLLSENSCPT
jgi:hypothetical protein